MLINDFKDNEKIQLDSVGELDVIFEYHKSFVIYKYHQRLNGPKFGYLTFKATSRPSMIKEHYWSRGSRT